MNDGWFVLVQMRHSQSDLIGNVEAIVPQLYAAIISGG